jgi:mannose-6-phosphate isomerase-like protein (cupin superfamily)
MGSLFERLASAAETSGTLGVSLVTQPPGVATLLHLHTREAEAFFLLDGTMSYQAGSTLYQLSAGYFIYLPKGVPHAFRVTGTSPVRFLGLAVPAGLMDLYDEVGMPATERRLSGLDGPRGGHTAVERSEPSLRASRCRATNSKRDLELRTSRN